MKKFTRLICATAVSTTMLAGNVLADSSEFERRRHMNSIVGAWEVEVTVRVDAPDCTTAAPVPFGVNPFPSLNTFHEGGTMSETGSRSPPSMRSPGHGVWKRTGRHSFVYRLTFQGFDGNGFLATNMDISSQLTLAPDGQTFKGVSRFAFSDVSGNTFPFCATLDGIRFAV